jgi:AraC-like DNA-binding protein
MVSIRCKKIVADELQKLNITYASIDLGMVELLEKITVVEKKKLGKNLSKFGFELLDHKKSVFVNKVKMLLVKIIYDLNHRLLKNYPQYISKKMNTSFADISDIFSEVNGITIQQFIIINTVEKAKELLLYDKLNLAEIAQKLHYGNVKKLSYQFKKVTGLPPSFYKNIKKIKAKKSKINNGN